MRLLLHALNLLAVLAQSSSDVGSGDGWGTVASFEPLLSYDYFISRVQDRNIYLHEQRFSRADSDSGFAALESMLADANYTNVVNSQSCVPRCSGQECRNLCDGSASHAVCQAVRSCLSEFVATINGSAAEPALLIVQITLQLDAVITNLYTELLMPLLADGRIVLACMNQCVDAWIAAGAFMAMPDYATGTYNMATRLCQMMSRGERMIIVSGNETQDPWYGWARTEGWLRGINASCPQVLTDMIWINTVDQWDLNEQQFRTLLGSDERIRLVYGEDDYIISRAIRAVHDVRSVQTNIDKPLLTVSATGPAYSGLTFDLWQGEWLTMYLITQRDSVEYGLLPTIVHTIPNWLQPAQGVSVPSHSYSQVFLRSQTMATDLFTSFQMRQLSDPPRGTERVLPQFALSTTLSQPSTRNATVARLLGVTVDLIVERVDFDTAAGFMVVGYTSTATWVDSRIAWDRRWMVDSLNLL